MGYIGDKSPQFTPSSPEEHVSSLKNPSSTASDGEWDTFAQAFHQEFSISSFERKENLITTFFSSEEPSETLSKKVFSLLSLQNSEETQKMVLKFLYENKCLGQVVEEWTSSNKENLLFNAQSLKEAIKESLKVPLQSHNTVHEGHSKLSLPLYLNNSSLSAIESQALAEAINKYGLLTSQD